MRAITRLLARSRLFLLLALLAAIVLPLVGSSKDEAVSQLDASAAPALPDWPRGDLLVGFNDAAYLSGGNGSRYDIGVGVEETVAWARAAGANSHRISADWGFLEPWPGQVRTDLLRRMRQLAEGFERNGGRVLVILGYAPAWAREPASGCRDCHGPPAENPQTMAAWDRYVRLMAETFPRAAAFEVWNEPNFRRFWYPRPDPARYARLVRRTAGVLRRAAPDAKVLAGAVLAVDQDVPEQGIMRSSEFLSQAFRAGLRGSYDAVSWHAYPSQGGEQVEPRGRDSVYRRSIADVQRAIQSADPGARQWVTETGVTTSGDGFGVSDREQQAALAEMLTLLSGDDRIDAIYVHRLFDALFHPESSRERGFGIAASDVEGAVRPKPAFCMLHAAARAPSVDPSGRCPPLARDRERAEKRRAAARRRRARTRRRARARRLAEVRRQRERSRDRRSQRAR